MINQEQMKTIATLREGVWRAMGYVDALLPEKDRLEQQTKLRSYWGRSFGARYGFYPLIEGSKLTGAYLRRFTFDKTVMELVEFMEDDITSVVYFFHGNQLKEFRATQEDINAYDDAEIYLAALLKETVDAINADKG